MQQQQLQQKTRDDSETGTRDAELANAKQGKCRCHEKVIPSRSMRLKMPQRRSKTSPKIDQILSHMIFKEPDRNMSYFPGLRRVVDPA